MNTSIEKYNVADIKEKNKILDKNALAMDALAKLALQFTEDTDYSKLLNSLLFTIAGQMSVNNAFVIILHEGDYTSNQYYCGIGKYKNSKLLKSIELDENIINFFKSNSRPVTVDELEIEGKSANFLYKLLESEVSLIGPLVLNNEILGILAIGERVNKIDFEPVETDILRALVNSITPFISNTFLFMEISNINKWYLEILNSVKHGLFIFDKNLKLKKINDAGFQILKAVKSKLKSKSSLHNVSMEFIFTENTFPGWTKMISEVCREKTKKVLKNLKLNNGDQDMIFNIAINSINYHNSETDHIITIDDVTVLKESEQRMFELEKFADKGVMASSIAHELNNFLGLILGGVELTSIHVKKGNNEKVANNIDKLKENINKMQRFTAGLMDYTKQQTTKSKCSLNTIIEDVIAFLTVQKRYDNVNILTNLDSRIEPIEIDSDQIAQLLLNFLNNAADAINAQQNEFGQIIIRTSQDENSLYLSIEDNGEGIKDELKAKLFNHHFTTKEHGHGYGLVTCYKIIKNHNAEIDVKSTLGEGTTFTLKFPVTHD
ncbi:MAG: GHKL domain-containing protein [Calditrichaeota bacterium]|nr:MAG: GHKL domain-containing protein [Calditrichota bacterium]